MGCYKSALCSDGVAEVSFLCVPRNLYKVSRGASVSWGAIEVFLEFYFVSCPVSFGTWDVPCVY